MAAAAAVYCPVRCAQGAARVPEDSLGKDCQDAPLAYSVRTHRGSGCRGTGQEGSVGRVDPRLDRCLAGAGVQGAVDAGAEVRGGGIAGAGVQGVQGVWGIAGIAGAGAGTAVVFRVDFPLLSWCWPRLPHR